MLRCLTEWIDRPLHAADGPIGSVQDFYFDDRVWTVRYVVADTGRWLLGRLVLISPVSIQMTHDGIMVRLTRKQVEDSPDLDSDSPVSRQHEAALSGYFGWPVYWMSREESREARCTATTERPSHLRSANELKTCYVQARDGDVGHVEDFVFDDISWEIRYLVVDIGNWWPGRRVLVARDWIDQIDWHNSTVDVNLSCDEIQRSPEYAPSRPVDRPYEERLYRHYRRPGYWN